MSVFSSFHFYTFSDSPILSLCWFIHAPHPPLRLLFSFPFTIYIAFPIHFAHTHCLLLTDLAPFRPLNPKNPCLSFSVSSCQSFYVGMKRSISLKQRINSLDKTSGREDTEREWCKSIYMNMYIHRLFIPIIVSKSEERKASFFSHRKMSPHNLCLSSDDISLPECNLALVRFAEKRTIQMNEDEGRLIYDICCLRSPLI